MHKYKHRHKRQANAVHKLKEDEQSLQLSCTMLFQIGFSIAKESVAIYKNKPRVIVAHKNQAIAYGLDLAYEGVANIGKSPGPNNLDKAIETMG